MAIKTIPYTVEEQTEIRKALQSKILSILTPENYEQSIGLILSRDLHDAYEDKHPGYLENNPTFVSEMATLSAQIARSMLLDKENIELIAESIVVKLEKKGGQNISDLRKEEGQAPKSPENVAQELLDSAGKDMVEQFFRESI